MTEEQIKQNAYDYLYNLNRSGIILTGNEVYNAYLTGAHSRDDEIEELKEHIKLLQDTLQTEQELAVEYIIDLKKELNMWRKEAEKTRE